MPIFQFDSKSNTNDWKIVNDTVMGGLSNANFEINNEGVGIFKGHVSIDNNGGFAMVEHKLDPLNVKKFKKFIIKLKGDGKTYQFRIKTNQNDKHFYIATFSSTTNWTRIEIPFNSMYPAYRGKKLNMGNYPGKQMELFAFLIGNKKEEDFYLEIKTIELK